MAKSSKCHNIRQVSAGKKLGGINLLIRGTNTLLRTTLLSAGHLPPEGRLPLQDLTLRLQQGQLELRCRRTGRRVLPRLSSAHNYTQQALPVYQLLCDLQTQGRQASLAISWAEFVPEGQFWPRLTNRAVSTHPRLHELLLYAFLARYYQARLAGQSA